MQSCSKSGGIKCVYKNCGNTSVRNSNLSFFRFPVKDKERCIDWIVNSGNDELAELHDTKLLNRVVCSLHFEGKAFTNSLRNRLLKNHPNAVPLPWFHDVHYRNSTPSNTLASQIEMSSASNEQSHQKNNTQKILSPASKQPQETFEEFCQEFVPLQEMLPTTPKRTVVAPLASKYQKDSPTPRKKKLLKTISTQKLRLKKKLNTISFLNRRKTKTNLESVTAAVGQFVSGEVLTFLSMQLRHQKKVKWTLGEKNFSLSLYYKSPSVYKFFREKGFKLPCLTQIRNWVNVHNVQPGFGEEVFSKLKTKAALMTEDERECVILLDEMTIAKCLQYNPKLDVVEGYQDLGPLGREGKIATHTNVFMVRGLKYPWKCPVSYVLSHNSTKHTSLAILIDLCLSKLRDASFYPKAIVNDLGSTNAAALRLLGATPETPYIMFQTEKVYCLFDFPHLIKCVRNNLLKHDFIVNNKVVSWNDLRIFYQIDKTNSSGCRAAPKLSERHVQPLSFQKMNVKLATQVFSHTVSKGMKTASKLGVAASCSMEDTADMFGRINDIFDSMNSKNLYDSNPLKRPLSKKNMGALKCLKDAIPYIKSWTIPNTSKPPCFDGLIQTLRGVLALYEEMPGNSFLMTGRLNQDPLENLFGVLRQRGGYNSNPTAREFRRNLQHSMSIRLLDPPGSSNCEPDGDAPLEVGNDNLEPALTSSAPGPEVLPNSHNYILSPPCHPDQPQSTELGTHEVHQLSPLEDNVVFYIAGWLAKRCVEKFSCDNCLKMLLEETGSILTDKETLLLLRSFTSHNGDIVNLSRPSQQLFVITKRQSWKFMQSIKSNLHERNLVLAHIQQLVEEDTKDTYPAWFDKCNDHKRYMMKLLIKCKIHYTLKWISNDLRDRTLLNLPKRSKKRCVNMKLNPKLKILKHV